MTDRYDELREEVLAERAEWRTLRRHERLSAALRTLAVTAAVFSSLLPLASSVRDLSWSMVIWGFIPLVIIAAIVSLAMAWRRARVGSPAYKALERLQSHGDAEVTASARAARWAGA